MNYEFSKNNFTYNLVVPDNSSFLEEGCWKGNSLALLNPDTSIGAGFFENKIKEVQ